MSWCSNPPKKIYPMTWKFPITERILVGAYAPGYEISVQPPRTILFVQRSIEYPEGVFTQAYQCCDCKYANLPDVLIPITEREDWMGLVAAHAQLHQDMLQWAQMKLRD